MSTRFTSSSGKHWGVYFDTDQTEDDAGYTVTWAAGMYADSGYSFSNATNTLSWSWSAGGSGSVTKAVSFGPGGTQALASGSCYVAKTHAYQEPTLTIALDRSSAGFMPGTASVSNAYAVSAKTSHTITFDDNGGSGGPGSTTKWINEDLAIPSAVPTRSGYTFLGWSRSSSATSAEYQPGQTYYGTADTAYTLYAIWSLDHVAPTATLTAYRVASSSATTASATGTYAYVVVEWAKGSDSVTSISISDTGSHTWTSSSATSGSSGTYTAHCPLAESDTVTVTATVSDGTATTTRAATIGTTTPPIDVGNRGLGVGLLQSVGSSDTGVHMGGEVYVGGARLPKLYVGTKVISVSGNNAARLWTSAEFKSAFGRTFNAATDFVGAMNADGNATSAHVEGVTFVSNELWAVLASTISGSIRINWLVALAP